MESLNGNGSNGNGSSPLSDPLVYLECLRLVSQRDSLAESSFQPVMINEIMAVEDELGASLPEQYEDFLIKVGPGREYGGLAIWYHLDLTRNGNILELNEKFRTETPQGEHKTPRNFLSIYDPCDGTLIGFARHNGSFSPEVLIWSPEDRTLETLADDFTKFLEDNIDCDDSELEEAERRALEVTPASS